VLEDLKDVEDQELLHKVCDFFMRYNEFEKAVGIMLKLGQTEQALQLIQSQNFTLDDDMADALTPEMGSVDNEVRNAVLISIGKIAKRQKIFALAAKKYTQFGAKLKAIKAVIKVGSLER
jgi:intraflagellar transport protein 140